MVESRTTSSVHFSESAHDIISNEDNEEVLNPELETSSMMTCKHSMDRNQKPDQLEFSVTFSERNSERSVLSIDVSTLPQDACIEHCEDGKDRVVLPSVQEYWHTYASWLACWPMVTEVRNDMVSFMNGWERQNSNGTIVHCFCVVHGFALRLRKAPSWREDYCIGKYLRPGQCFVVNEIVKEGQVNYLKLADGSGWVFDRMDDTTMCARMEAIEFGQWWYRITTKDFVEVRSAPSDNDDCRSGWIMCPQEVTLVNLRCNIVNHRFLHLADGRGWLFEKKPGSIGRKSDDPIVMSECSVEHQVELAAQKRVTVEGLTQESRSKGFSPMSGKSSTGVKSSPAGRKKGQKKAAASQNQSEAREKDSPTNRVMRCFALCARSSAVK